MAQPTSTAGRSPRRPARATERAAAPAAAIRAVTGGPTYVRVADALAGGATKAELRRVGSVAPLHGLRCTAGEHDPASLAHRCGAVLAVAPPGTVVSHESAAGLQRLWLPARYARAGRDVHVMCPDSRHRVRRSGVVTHIGIGRRDVTTVHGGVPVVSTADTWADLAGELDVVSLVVVGDCVAARSGGMAALQAVVVARSARRARNARAMRQALEQVRAGSRSPQESLARLMFVRAGLPEPLLNRAVHDADGDWLGEPDFVWPDARVYGEYQGDQHRQRRQAVRDTDKRRALEAAGWRGFDMWSDHLRRAPKAREIVQHAASLLGVPYDPDLVVPTGSGWAAG